MSQPDEKYFISVNGTRVEVTQEIYLCYYRAKRRMRYYEWDVKIGTPILNEDKEIIGYAPSKEDSLERLFYKGEDFVDEFKSVEDEVLKKIMSDKLRSVLNELPLNERQLLDALYFANNGDGMTEREYSAKFGIPQQTVNDRKRRLLKKLKSFF